MKTKLIVNAREGVNNLKLGMPRKEVHVELGLPSKSFLKFSDDKNMSEKYNAIGVILYYDKNDRLKAIEAWDEAKLFFKNFDLFQMNHAEALAFFKELDPQLKILSDGFISNKLGLNTWYEDEVSNESKFTSVTIFKDENWNERP
jgi:hypothetical protein